MSPLSANDVCDVQEHSQLSEALIHIHMIHVGVGQDRMGSHMLPTGLALVLFILVRSLPREEPLCKKGVQIRRRDIFCSHVVLARSLKS